MCSNSVSSGFVSVLQWLNLTGENMNKEHELTAALATIEKLRAELEQLTAENVALKNVFGPGDAVLNFLTIALRHTTYDQIDLDDVSLAFKMSLPETHATDRIVAGVKADGVESGIKTIMVMLNHQAPGVSDAINVLRIYCSKLREVAKHD